jgi:hypothetical protein
LLNEQVCGIATSWLQVLAAQQSSSHCEWVTSIVEMLQVLTARQYTVQPTSWQSKRAVLHVAATAQLMVHVVAAEQSTVPSHAPVALQLTRQGSPAGHVMSPVVVTSITQVPLLHVPPAASHGPSHGSASTGDFASDTGVASGPGAGGASSPALPRIGDEKLHAAHTISTRQRTKPLSRESRTGVS